MEISGALPEKMGKPITASIDVSFPVYGAEAGGDPLGFETQSLKAAESQIHLAVHRVTKQPRGARSLPAAAGDERAALVVPLREARQQPSPAQSAVLDASHLGVRIVSLHNHQSGHGLPNQLLMPVRPSFEHAGPVAFGAGQSFS